MLRNKVIPAVVGGAIFLMLTNSFASSESDYKLGERRDPFVPLTGEETPSVIGASSLIKLEGIIYDPGKQSMAILNGKPYKAGDVMENATLIKILKDHVVIFSDGKEKKLWIRKNEKIEDL